MRNTTRTGESSSRTALLSCTASPKRHAGIHATAPMPRSVGTNTPSVAERDRVRSTLRNTLPAYGTLPGRCICFQAMLPRSSPLGSHAYATPLALVFSRIRRGKALSNATVFCSGSSGYARRWSLYHAMLYASNVTGSLMGVQNLLPVANSTCSREPVSLSRIHCLDTPPGFMLLSTTSIAFHTHWCWCSGVSLWSTRMFSKLANWCCSPAGPVSSMFACAGITLRKVRVPGSQAGYDGTHRP